MTDGIWPASLWKLSDIEMALQDITDRHQEALSRLELEELSLLNWGAVDGSFSKEEAEKIIARVPEAVGDESQILNDLIDALLVVRVGNSIPKRFRTRFGETVRLLIKLRQLKRERPWRDGLHLVADAQILHRPRQFPRRFITVEELGTRLEREEFDLPLIDHVRQLVNGRLLADFQLDATARILRSLESESTSGFVISASTSGGKSLAFYLPAMAWIARSVRRNDPWVKALALYPRQELLKDQLSSAYASARLLDEDLRRQGRPVLSVGAFYGDTPYNSRVFGTANSQFLKSWFRTRTGRICPFLRCPLCEGDMEWNDIDIKKGAEKLHCRSIGCEFVTPPESLRLTRNSMIETPPDILLTTTEMLNRNMSAKPQWKLFGVRTRPPRMVLMDEIHTNEGASGAQIALLIRRWRFLARAQVCTFVGLSATLANPQRFFSDLTGLYESQIIPIEPDPNNMVFKGAEYLLALRSDPTTGVSTLSTTIQTLMLLRRMLDGPGQLSNGVIGQRIFAFTDKLDVLNRLYDDFGDAEGWDRFQKVNSRYQMKTLAALRQPNPGLHDFAAREADGQIWSTAQQLGHNLLADQQLTVGRTAASDPGVSAKDVIIATSSLEVGFNDPSVGGVVQHKAPRGSASFLQRKGRSGRTESMRPFTVVVLSDFGRDRIAYLSFERLFSPELDPINLPVKNRYVLRMQATYSMIDWLAHQVFQDQDKYPNAWQIFSAKVVSDKGIHHRARNLLSEVLSGGPARNHLRNHLARSLGLENNEVEALMWAPPRSLLLHVLPTLHRNLTSWLDQGLKDVAERKGRPLSEFIPQAMFNELLLPEVEMRIPAATKRNDSRAENLGVGQALRDFVPGKFNRRFGFTHGTESHWIPVSPNLGTAVVQVPGESYEGEWLPDVTERNEDGTTRVIRVFRPTAMNLVYAKSLSASTNAFPEWKAAIEYEHAHKLELTRSPWLQLLVKELEVFAHSLGGTLQIRRYIPKCDGRLVSDRGEETLYSTVFQDSANRDAALGFMLDVDGIRVSLAPPDFDFIKTSKVLPALLSIWLSELFLKAEGIAHINSFGRQQLLVVVMGAIAKVKQAPNLRVAWEEVTSDRDLELLRNAAKDIAAASSGDSPTELLSNLLEWIKDQSVITAIGKCIDRTDSTDPDFTNFVSRRYLATMAGAFVQSMISLVPSMTSDDVSIDIQNTKDGNGEFLFWVSETEAGSSGIVEAFVTYYQQDPQLFWRYFERSLDPSDLELVDGRIAEALYLASVDDEVTSAWVEVRKAMDLSIDGYRTSLARLFDLLRDKGIEVDHLVRSSLASRILSAGSSSKHDILRTELRSDWIALEDHYGLEFDMRSFACRWSEEPKYDAVIGNGVIDPCERHAFFTNLLWLRGGLVREIQFDSSQLFGSLPKADRLLIPTPPRNAVHVSEGRLMINSLLLTNGEATVWAKNSEKHQLAAFLQDLAVNPTETAFMNVFPRMTSAVERSGEIHCRIEIVEVEE